MSQLFYQIASLFIIFSAHGEKVPKATDMKIVNTRGSLQLKFHKNLFNEISKNVPAVRKDSVLVIFDRFDHTGAGVIYHVFYENEEHCVNIPDIPKGKYYVTIQCLGIHRDRAETVVTIKSQKTETLKINQVDSEEFFKSNVVIPPFHPDYQNLAVVNAK